MAGSIQLATIKAPIVADQSNFKKGMQEVKKDGKATAEGLKKGFGDANDAIKKGFKESTEAAKKTAQETKKVVTEAEKLTKSAKAIYKDGYGKSMKDVVKSLEEAKYHMGDLEGEELETATKRAMELRDTLGVKFSTTLTAAKKEMDQYGSTADEAFDRITQRIEETNAAWEKVNGQGEKLQSFGSKMTVGLTVPIVGVATAITKTAADFESANAKIVSSMGLTEAQSQVTKQSLEDVFRDGYGEDINDVADAIGQVKNQLHDVSDQDLTKVTENALVLRDTLGQDMGESLRGINSLMTNFKMSADDAMDLYVKGVQTGLDKTGELGDNLAEYGQIWSQAGFDAKSMFEVLDNGLESGAYNLDKVNDFVKEFTISLTDGRIEENLKSFSKETQSVFKEFKNGKKTSQDVFKSVIGDLEGTESQQKKLTLASTVWSALGEDNAMNIIESLNDVNHTYDDVAGSMKKVADQQNKTFGARAKTLLRDAQTALLPLGETLLDLAEDYLPDIEKAVQSFSDTLKEMDEEDIKKVLKIGGFIAIAGPTVVGIGKVTSAISTIGSAAKVAIPFLSGGSGLAEGFSAAAGSAGLLTGVLPALVGAGGLLALGYGAWKLVGEEAYNASQRQKEYGDGVSEQTAKSIEDVTGYATKVNGQFGLMAQGLSTNKEDMDASLKGLGESMQSYLVDKVDALKEALDGLPADVKGAAEETVNEEIAQAKEHAKIIEDNTAQIAAINKSASDSHRALTAEDGVRIQALLKENAEAYLSETITDKKKRKEVLTTMTGDVEDATKKQAEAMLKSLVETRGNIASEQTKQYNDYVKKLKDSGLSESEQKYFADMFQQSREDATAGVESQINAVMDKYPELVETIDLYTGKVIDKNSEYYAILEGANERLLATFADNNNAVKDGTKETADTLKIAENEAEEYGSVWNNMVFDKKTGKVVSNVGQVVGEATKDEAKWNQLFNAAKEAKLSTNSKEVLAVASIENGRWETMTFADKEMLLESNASSEIIQALEVNKDWEKLTFEQKQALVYSNTPEKMAENMAAFGLWDKYSPMVKSLGADNYQLMNALATTEGAIDEYNGMSPELMTLLADGPAEMDVKAAGKAISDYNNLSPELQKLLADNTDAVSKTNAAKVKVLEFNNASGTGHLRVNTSEVSPAVSYAKQKLDEIHDKYVKVRVQNITENITESRDRKFAKGTDYHRGGLALVNDQKGSSYRELVTLPGGQAFVPQGRNVMLDLPRGTQVNTASETKSMFGKMKRYATGVGNKLPMNLSRQSNPVLATQVNFSGADQDFSKALNLITQLITQEKIVVLEADNRKIAEGTWKYVDQFASDNNDRKSILKTARVTNARN